MEIRKFLIFITLVLLMGLILAIWFFPLNDDFRVENPFWNGIKNINNEYHFMPLDSLDDLPPLAESTTLITIPCLNYTGPELEQLKKYIASGGRLILADDYGHGNQVMQYLELKERFSGQAILDPLVNYKNKYFPRIVNFSPDSLTNNTDNLVFNHGTSLVSVNATDAIALSSPFSFLDKNDNGIHEDDEPVGPLPVITRQSLGKGQVILVADPSLFINSMDNVENNADFIKNISATTNALYLDQSHLKASELQRAKSWLKQARRVFTTPAGAIILVTAVIVTAATPLWHKKESNR